MRISFSNAATQAFWTLPVHALAPWINRIRTSLGQAAASPPKLRVIQTVKPVFSPLPETASNDSVFGIFPETALPPCKIVSPASSRSILRVVRESDAGINADCAGRMVISGRMSDVCAELDRMAERAAAIEAARAGVQENA